MLTPLDQDRGWQGDILDRQAVEELVADIDVVIHLAFIIFGSREESARVNLAGARNVFEATGRRAAALQPSARHSGNGSSCR